MAFLELRDLSKSFKDQKVIRELSVEVEKGEFLVVFGPSGCGKTVLLRLIAGMMRPELGRYRHRGPVGRRRRIPSTATLAWRSRITRSTRT